MTLAVQSAASLATETLQFDVPCINRQFHTHHYYPDVPPSWCSVGQTREICIYEYDTACLMYVALWRHDLEWSAVFWHGMPQSPSGFAICSGSSGCPCHCNYATDSTCQCRDLAQMLNVTVTKSAVYASYPLIYQQAFNYQPYEVGMKPCLWWGARVVHAAQSVWDVAGLFFLIRIWNINIMDPVLVLGVTSTIWPYSHKQCHCRRSSGQVGTTQSQAVSMTRSAQNRPVAGPLMPTGTTSMPARVSAARAQLLPLQLPPSRAAPTSVQLRQNILLSTCLFSTKALCTWG